MDRFSKAMKMDEIYKVVSMDREENKILSPELTQMFWGSKLPLSYVY